MKTRFTIYFYEYKLGHSADQAAMNSNGAFDGESSNEPFIVSFLNFLQVFDVRESTTWAASYVYQRQKTHHKTTRELVLELGTSQLTISTCQPFHEDSVKYFIK